MNVDKIIKKLYDRIDIVGESKMMHNRFYVSKANKLINKLKLNIMKGSEPMNWTKRQTQCYGGFLAVLGLLIGIFVTTLVIAVI